MNPTNKSLAILMLILGASIGFLAASNRFPLTRNAQAIPTGTSTVNIMPKSAPRVMQWMGAPA